MGFLRFVDSKLGSIVPPVEVSVYVARAFYNPLGGWYNFLPASEGCKGGVVIQTVIGLRKDGNEQPQFYELSVKYDAVGSPDVTRVYGPEVDLREVLRDGGLPTVQIDSLFSKVR